MNPQIRTTSMLDQPPASSNPLRQLFSVNKPIIGMVHVKPLPGSPRAKAVDLEAVYDAAVEEALRLVKGGVDGLLLENAGDIPFLKPEDIGYETVGAMSVVGDRIRKATRVPLGFNIVANAARASLACARSSNADFVRVNQWANAYVANEGIIEGAAPRALRYRSAIGGDNILVFADVHVKHGSHAIVGDRDLSEQTRDVEFFGADVLIATGNRTGHAAEVEEIEGIRKGATRPILVGSGITPDTAETLLTAADGAIVGSWFKDTNNMWGVVVPDKVSRLMEKVQRFR
jgi:membrane complex biogenesis BtpA family protein